MAFRKGKPVGLPLKRLPGRTTVYTKDLGEEICNRLMEGETMPQICQDDHMPNVGTVLQWALGNIWGRPVRPDEPLAEFPAMYARARKVQAELLVDMARALTHKDRKTTKTVKKKSSWTSPQGSGSNDSEEEFTEDNIARTRLEVDTLKWFASKVYPRLYGDRPLSEEDKSSAGSLRLVNDPDK